MKNNILNLNLGNEKGDGILSKKNILEDESGTGIIGAMSGGLLGAMVETGILACDISGIGIGNLPGIYPWTALHIYPLIGLTTMGGILGGAVGTAFDTVVAASTMIAGTFASLGCAGSSAVGFLMGSLFSK